ncbi:MAG: transaldolase [Helicobacteraceae bacterium]|jgi:transaldolase|nr:transaldolase [Helicobacteraceae bacterium]
MGKTSFSLWIDYLDQDFIRDDLPEYLERGARGVTTNPAIFRQAIVGKASYKARIDDLRQKGLNGKRLYEALAIVDAQNAADALKPYFDGADGFVSIEVDPALSSDAAGTIEEARRLYRAIGRENVMIKIPATGEGFIAIKELLQSGVPINATLVFSPDQTRRTLRAAKNGETPMVISVFVSRFDRAIDERLPRELRAKTGIINAANCYNLVAEADRKNVRVLFASTGVKESALSADYYIRELFGDNLVNTAPLAAIDAFLDGKDRTKRIPIAQDTIETFLAKIEKLGADFERLCDKLLAEGLAQFERAFSDILSELA